MPAEAVVKSVGRMFALLEYLDDIKRPASTMEISRALAIPQSSTSALLRSLVMLGYCRQDAPSRTYAPTARVTLLGSWLSPPLVENGALIRMLHELSDRTGEHILLAALNGLLVRYIYTIPARQPGRPSIRTGTLRLLGRSGAGNLFLSTRPDSQIASLVRRVNASERNVVDRIDIRALMAEIAVIRTRGYAFTIDRLDPGVGGVNVLLPRFAQMQPMAVAISSASDIITAHHERLFALVGDASRRHLGLELPSIAPKLA
ncbi:MAG TPA: helix-turn-helix domain-containing protein [Rhodopila sp.]